MDNFNLKKFLTENKLTTNSKVVNEYGGYAASLVGLVDEYIDKLEGTISTEEIVAELVDLRTFIGERLTILRTELQGGNELEEGYSDYYDSEASKIVGRKLRGIVDIFSKSKADELAEIEAAIQAAEQETGTQVTSRETSYLKDQASLMRMQDIEMER